MAHIVAAVAAVIGAGSSIYQARQARSAANDQARLNELQAQQDAENRDMERRRLLSSQRAAYGASGVKVDEGTPLTVYAETNRIADQDIQNILTMGRLRGQVNRREGRAVMVSGYASAAGSLLKGTGALAKKYKWGTK